MAVQKPMRLSQVARKLNVGSDTIVEFLGDKGMPIEHNPNTKITPEQYELLAKEFAASLHEKEEAENISIGTQRKERLPLDIEQTVEKDKPKPKEEDSEIRITNLSSGSIKEEESPAKEEEAKPKLKGLKVLDKIDLDKPKAKPAEKKEEAPAAKEEPAAEKPSAKEPAKPDEAKEVIEAKADKLRGLKVLDTIELPKPVASSDTRGKRQRKRITTEKPKIKPEPKKKLSRRERARMKKEEPSEQEVQQQIKETLAKLSQSKKKTGAKYRKEKKAILSQKQAEQVEEDSKVLKVQEFISVSDLAALMDVSPNEVIATCLNLGMMVSINQRLDAEVITIVADEFGYTVEFADIDEELAQEEEDTPDREEDLVPRAPIVTLMGHVDHGKTSLLDYIRKSRITEKEAGGITQHIGAYDVMTESGQRIAFLDTPGHEAFTAMRARGAKITDVVIIVIAADDGVMPQTKEAINHAQVAGVPMVFAINKIDSPNANPDKIKEELANINILVEDWGGKYQSQEVSAKTGQGVEELLEKVLIETELMELKANPNKPARGTVIEASLDKGRGYVTTVMVQDGTLHVGDVAVAGTHFGRVKAMFNHLGEKVKEAGPSTPVLMLGMDGAPQAGDSLKVMPNEKAARELVTKREQLVREQKLRTKKHITLDEIGRRLAIGNFKELNIIVKGDVDGSVEALSDSLLKLSNEEIQVNVVHKGVGQISESDVLLASAADAVIIGFQVRPSSGAKRLAETEDVEIRLYSVIYDAINEVKDAMEGMLAPEEEEVVVGNAEIREVFKISKVGTVAGCMVTNGVIKRTNNVRIIRDGIVIYTGEVGQLKRFKEDVQEVKSGYECGMSFKNFNDLKVGDEIESYEIREIKRTL